MATSRRARLARTLSRTSDMTYQQALTVLDAHTALGGHLPRNDDELAALSTQLHGAANPSPLRSVADVPAEPLAFTIRFSDVARCPISSMSVTHFLPDGTCAHAHAPCPTCAGRGRLRDRSGAPVTCSSGAGLPAGVPVCDGHGVWAGGRA